MERIFVLETKNICNLVLSQDLVFHVLIPYLFETCRNCSSYTTFEEEKQYQTCEDCLFSICNHCDTKGTEYDFHSVYLFDGVSGGTYEWYCEVHGNQKNEKEYNYHCKRDTVNLVLKYQLLIPHPAQMLGSRYLPGGGLRSKILGSRYLPGGGLRFCQKKYRFFSLEKSKIFEENRKFLRKINFFYRKN